MNVSTSAFFRDGRLDLVMRLLPGPGPAEEFLKGRRISTDYLGSKRYKVIEGFARHPKGNPSKGNPFMGASEAIMDVTNARYPSGKVSVAEWFKNEHRQGKPLLEPKMPLILAGTTKIGDKDVPCWLPAEECCLVPWQPYKKRLSPQQTTKMVGRYLTFVPCRYY